MSVYKRRSSRRKWAPEAPKDHSQIPDGLGIGVHEVRDPDGQLYIYFQRNPSVYVVLGSYKDEAKGPYYVADYTHGDPWLIDGKWGEYVTKHEHLILAIAKIHEIKEDYERQKQ